MRGAGYAAGVKASFATEHARHATEAYASSRKGGAGKVESREAAHRAAERQGASFKEAKKHALNAAKAYGEPVGPQ